MTKKLQVCLFLAVALLFSSCRSYEDRVRDFDSAPLFGMIYDRDNVPCPGALLVVDEVEGPVSDINGRFVIVNLTRGVHAIVVKKKGYEELVFELDFLDRTQVLYLQAISAVQLMEAAEDSLAARRFEQAAGYLARAEKIVPDDPVGMYLRAAYHRSLGDADEAVRVLRRMLEMRYEEPAVYLALADIHQYDLEDSETAAAYLSEYLKLQGDYEAESRLEELQKKD